MVNLPINLNFQKYPTKRSPLQALIKLTKKPLYKTKRSNKSLNQQKNINIQIKSFFTPTPHLMNHTNPRANTIISQSFIASEFQGYNDPFTKTEPTSSLVQLGRSKQTSNSGFINQGETQTFGFGNITNNQSRALDNFSRRANESMVVMVASSNVEENRNNPKFENYGNQRQVQTQHIKQQQQFMQIPQQINQRYVSPNVTKSDSPTKPGQYAQQPQRSPQFFTSPQAVYNQSPNQNNSFKQPQSTQGFSNQASRTQVVSQPSRPQTFSNKSQYSQQQLTRSQLGQSQFSNQGANMQQNLEGSSVGKKFKLNVSQEFSNSFVLNCINQPQKSSIQSMKQRQRQFRKSIQNFFV